MDQIVISITSKQKNPTSTTTLASLEQETSSTLSVSQQDILESVFHGASQQQNPKPHIYSLVQKHPEPVLSDFSQQQQNPKPHISQRLSDVFDDEIVTVYNPFMTDELFFQPGNEPSSRFTVELYRPVVEEEMLPKYWFTSSSGGLVQDQELKWMNNHFIDFLYLPYLQKPKIEKTADVAYISENLTDVPDEEIVTVYNIFLFHTKPVISDFSQQQNQKSPIYVSLSEQQNPPSPIYIVQSNSLHFKINAETLKRIISPLADSKFNPEGFGRMDMSANGFDVMVCNAISHVIGRLFLESHASIEFQHISQSLTDVSDEEMIVRNPYMTEQLFFQSGGIQTSAVTDTVGKFQFLSGRGKVKEHVGTPPLTPRSQASADAIFAGWSGDIKPSYERWHRRDREDEEKKAKKEKREDDDKDKKEDRDDEERDDDDKDKKEDGDDEDRIGIFIEVEGMEDQPAGSITRSECYAFNGIEELVARIERHIEGHPHEPSESYYVTLQTLVHEQGYSCLPTSYRHVIEYTDRVLVYK